MKRKLLALILALLPLGAGACALSGISGGAIAVGENYPPNTTIYEPGSGRFLQAGRAGLLRSSERGDFWSPLPVRGPLPGEGLTQIAVSYEDPKLIAVSGPGSGVLVSRDSGKEWRESNAGLPSMQVHALTVHTKQPLTLYAAVEGKGIYRTESGGELWQRMDDGPPVSRITALVHSSLPGSMNTGWLYAAAPEGLFISMDCF